MPLLFIAIPLFTVVVLNIAVIWADKKIALWAGMIVALVQVGLSAADIFKCLHSGSAISSQLITSFSIDLLSAVVLLIIGMIAFVSLVVASSTVKTGMFNYGNVTLLIMIGMNGIAMVTDLFSLYVFIEVTSACSFILIAINKRRDELEGAFKYYMMSAIATVMMLISIAFIFMFAGDTGFASVGKYIAGLNGRYPFEILIAFILFTAALAIKSGVVPFHTWVPDAHSSAPSPVSVLLAGVVIKVSGVYALMRIYKDVFMNNPALGNVLIVLGLFSIIVGALGAIGQNDIKRMLAYSSVSQIGYIILGIGTGSALGFAGALLHFFNHSTFKSLLFVDSAAIVMQTGTRDMDKMGGLAEKMPVTGVSSILALLSMAGIPPLSGFWSKLLIILAVWKVSSASAIIALCSSIITLGYFLVLQKKVFFGKPAAEMQNVRECNASIVGVEVFLSSINVAVGILFPFILMYMQGKGLI